MNNRIPFSKVIKDPENWIFDMDLDVMTENYRILKQLDLIDKLFFESIPEHPGLFVVFFSQEIFVYNLLKGLADYQISIKNLEGIYLKEYPYDSKVELVKKGILTKDSLKKNNITSFLTSNYDTLFINVFPSWDIENEETSIPEDE